MSSRTSASASGLGQIGPEKMLSVSSPCLLNPGKTAPISTSCEGQRSDGDMIQLKAELTLQPAVAKHHKAMKSLCTHHSNQAPIKDIPSSTLLTSLLSLLPNINNETTNQNQVCLVCYFDQAKKKKKKSNSSSYFIVKIWFFEEDSFL